MLQDRVTLDTKMMHSFIDAPLLPLSADPALRKKLNEPASDTIPKFVHPNYRTGRCRCAGAIAITPATKRWKICTSVVVNHSFACKSTILFQYQIDSCEISPVQNQCSPHIVSRNAELLLRKGSEMGGFRILIAEPCENNFGKLKAELKKTDPTIRPVHANLNLSSVTAMVNSVPANDHAETVLIGRGKHDVRAGGESYVDLKSFVADLNQFLLRLLHASGNPELNKH